MTLAARLVFSGHSGPLEIYILATLRHYQGCIPTSSFFGGGMLYKLRLVAYCNGISIIYHASVFLSSLVFIFIIFV